MPVEPEQLTAKSRSCKQVSKDAEPLQVRNANDDRHESIRKCVLANIDRFANATDCGGRIERRTHFVMHDTWSMIAKRLKDVGQSSVHFRGRHRAAVAGYADCAHVRITPQHLSTRRFDEQRGFDAAQRQRLQRVGRAGEVIGVVGQ